MVVQPGLLTVEAFWQQYAGKPFELIRGEAIEIVPTGYLHGSTVAWVCRLLLNFVEKHRLGNVVGGETGFYLGPDTMRAADVAFIGNEKLNTILKPEKYLPFPPDLAIEIVSPGDMPGEIQEKLDLYLEAGTPLVWILFADLRKVVAHYADGRMQSLSVGQTLDGGDVLPGLKIPVADLFPPEQE